MSSDYEWRPLDALLDQKSSSLNTAIVILNQPITKENESKLIRLWKSSIVKFCVDGGANRLYEWCISRKKFNNNNEECDQYVPDYVCGDLDSIEDHVMQYYESKGVKLVRLNNQDLTDFTKTLKFAINCISNGQVDYDLIDSQKDLPKYSLNENEINKLKKIKIDQVYCICDFSGRLDHALSNLSTLYNDCLSNVNTYIISSESLTFLLKKGKNILHVNNDECRGKYCGFFPLGKSCLVSTSGLKWNLNKQKMTFDSFISSSNEYNEDVLNDSNNQFVSITTDEPLMWTMSVL